MIPYSMSDLPDKINAILRFLYSYPIEIKNDEAAIAVTKELRRVDEGSYQYIRNSLFPGSDAHPTGARVDYDFTRQRLRITLQGLPYAVLTKFVSQIRYSLIWQGFLSPEMTAECLVTSGSKRFILPSDPNKKVRELQPSASLSIVTHPTPFLLVEVIDSAGYVNGLEKGIWALKNCNGATKIFIIISLVRKDKKGKGKADGQGRASTTGSIFNNHNNTGHATHGPPKAAEEVESSNHATENWVAVSGSTTPAPFSTPQSEDDYSDDSSGDSLVDAATQILSALGNNTNHPGVLNCSHYSSEPSCNASQSGCKLETEGGDRCGSNIDDLSSVCSTDDGTNVSDTECPYPFTKATVTVLTYVESEDDFIFNRIENLVQNVEVWPAAPGPDVQFTFGWEDLPHFHYNRKDMKNRTFTIHFEGLHKLINDFINTGSPDWIKEQMQYSVDDLNFDDSDIEDGWESDGDVGFADHGIDEMYFEYRNGGEGDVGGKNRQGE